MAILAQRVNMPPVLIGIEKIVSCRKGVARRIKRERSKLRNAKNKMFIINTRVNIYRLQIIKEELKQLEKEL